MVRLLPKTFSNCNQFVSCFLKLFDRVWKDFMSVKKTYFFVSNDNNKKETARIYTLDSEKTYIQQRNSR